LLVSRQCIKDVFYVKEKKLLQVILRKKKEMTCQDSKMEPPRNAYKDFTCRHIYSYSLRAHTFLYTKTFLPI